MKNLLSATLPALALLALSGCATTGALSSTEDDGVYYSSKDRTTAVATPPAAGYQNSNDYNNSAQATTPPVGDNANPDYQGGTAQTGTTDGTDYYDDSYSSGSPSPFGQPYTGPGVSTTNYSPSWSVAPSAFASPFGYGAGLSLAYGYGGFGGYSPFGYGFGGYPGGFYDPFYSPFGFGYGSGLSIGFGVPFGYGFGSPFGYGYSPYAYGYPYGGGYYGDVYGGYRRAYGYSRSVIYANGTRSGSGTNPVLVGPRGGRGGSVLNGATAGGASPAVGNPNAVNIGNARRRGFSPTDGGVVAPGNPGYTTPAGQAATAPQGGRGGRLATFGNGEMVGQPASTAGASAPQPVQNQNSGGRRGFFGSIFGASNGAATPNNAGTAGSDPQMQRRSYSQPSYNQQRTYSQPAYSQPSRSYSQPSYSQPQRSFGGGGGNSGGGGGGNFGGGGGGRRR